MALNGKWLDGDLVFFDGSQEVYRLKNGTEGIVVGTNMTYPDPTTATTTGTITLTTVSNRIQFLDPNTATNRTVTLSPTADSAGIKFDIFNTGTSGDLLVKTTGASTVVTITQNEGAMVACDGSNWYGMVGANT